MFVYLDNSATTKPAPAVVEAMTAALTEGFGNPSSMYRLGLDAEKNMKAARSSVAKTLNALPSEIFFTSGGTESDNTALKGVWESRKKQGNKIITTAVEHPAILKTCQFLQKQGAEIVYLPVDSRGLISLADLEAALDENTILVSVMHVNNESGAIMPIKEIRQLLDSKKSGALFHVDAVQSWGKINTDVKYLGVDLMSVSGHKVHGPKGIGALYVRSGLHIQSFIQGGGQESDFRSGTENMPGIVGIGAAAEILLAESGKKRQNMAACKEHLKSRIFSEISDVKLNGPDDGVCSVLNISFIGCRGEVLLHTLDMDGICVSTGSACSSHSHGSHVLTAMNLKPEELEGAVRFSLCGDNTIEEMDYVVDRLKLAVASQRKLRSAFKKGNKR